MHLPHGVDRVLSFFSIRRNWDSLIPHPPGECAPPWFRGERQGTLACERGGGGPYSDEGTYTVVLYVCLYFVICSLCWSIHHNFAPDGS